MAAEAAATLLLVRHGEIAANAARVWHGSTDSALTELGHAQAERTGLHLAKRGARPAALYTSPLSRARETARRIGGPLGLEPRVEPGLAEYGIGELEGQTYEDLVRVHRFFARIAHDPEFAPPGGESPRQVVARVTDALARLAREHRGREVVVVSHGAALGLALGSLLHGDPNQWQRYHLANCAVSELVLEPAPRLLSWNGIEHL
ncbi:MAG TPA: histidine phosphatase family protein [Myxococcota bacterium]|nr:histidine phosphatase family protein [Myxococcota bacterium]